MKVMLESNETVSFNSDKKSSDFEHVKKKDRISNDIDPNFSNFNRSKTNKYRKTSPKKMKVISPKDWRNKKNKKNIDVDFEKQDLDQNTVKFRGNLESFDSPEHKNSVFSQSQQIHYSRIKKSRNLTMNVENLSRKPSKNQRMRFKSSECNRKPVNYSVHRKEESKKNKDLRFTDYLQRQPRARSRARPSSQNPSLANAKKPTNFEDSRNINPRRSAKVKKYGTNFHGKKTPSNKSKKNFGRRVEKSVENTVYSNRTGFDKVFRKKRGQKRVRHHENLKSICCSKVDTLGFQSVYAGSPEASRRKKSRRDSVWKKFSSIHADSRIVYKKIQRGVGRVDLKHRFQSECYGSRRRNQLESVIKLDSNNGRFVDW